MWNALIDALKRFGIGVTIRFKWNGGRVSNYKYFKDEEIVGLDKELVAKLDVARGVAGIPFRITSGKRTVEQNSVLKGAVADSSHLTGLAVDLWVEDYHAYCVMLKGLYAAGFRRFGHYFTIEQTDPINFIPRHIHVDVDATKLQDCSWCKREQ
jgi:hypothetical protein